MDALGEGRATLHAEVVNGVVGEGAAAGAAGGGQPEQEQQPAVEYRARLDHDMKMDWLHRGDREPL
eukprot:1406848-Pyramimonas_sp.AAC.1